MDRVIVLREQARSHKGNAFQWSGGAAIRLAREEARKLYG